MGYQKYLEHLSITLPGTMPMSFEQWERAQSERIFDSALLLMRRCRYSVSEALKACGLEDEALEDAQAELNRRQHKD